MNKIYPFLVLVFALTTVVSSCKKDETLNKPEEPIYFQVEYNNDAWGHHHRGIIINNDGIVYSYNLPETWTYAKDNYVSETGMQQNLENAVVFETEPIGQTDLAKMQKLALSAAKGKLTEPENRMVDAGITSYRFYIFDQQKQAFKSYLLLSEGDFYIENTSPAAALISDWLKKIYGND